MAPFLLSDKILLWNGKISRQVGKSHLVHKVGKSLKEEDFSQPLKADEYRKAA